MEAYRVRHRRGGQGDQGSGASRRAGRAALQRTVRNSEIRTRVRLLVTALVAAALLMAGCGSDEEGAPIPAASAQALQRQLDSIEARIDNGTVGACRDITGGAQPNTDAVQNIIDSLPKGVDADVKHAL